MAAIIVSFSKKIDREDEAKTVTRISQAVSQQVYEDSIKNQKEIDILNMKILELNQVIEERNRERDTATNALQDIQKKLDFIYKEQKSRSNITSRGGDIMRATAYDLTVESCGKATNHPEYGITATGTKAKAGRTVAVDPNIIPLGSKLYISFPDEYKALDGYYIAEDTGRLIKGNIIDIFLGEEETKKAMQFGVRKVKVYIIK